MFFYRKNSVVETHATTMMILRREPITGTLLSEILCVCCWGNTRIRGMLVNITTFPTHEVVSMCFLFIEFY